MTRILRIAAALLLLAAAAPASAQGKLMPVDQAARDPSFIRFRARLLDAVRRKDAEQVYAVLAPDVTSSFGGNGGVAEFREMWGAEHPASELWTTLGEVLRLGGTFMGDSVFAAPYVHGSWPDGVDPFQYGAITGTGVRVRGEPWLGAPVIGSLSYDIVATTGERGSNGFRAIRLPDGRRGYVSTQYFRRPVDYRAIFVRRNGRWLLKALVAGD